MTKKQVKSLTVFLQAILIICLFLPVGRSTVSDSKDMATLSVFGMIRRYAGLGFSNDALIYMIFSCCLPVLTILFLLCLKDRKNFATAAWLSALYSLAGACFYSAARVRMVDSVAMTGLHYLILLISMVSLGLTILGFFLAAPQPGAEKE